MIIGNLFLSRSRYDDHQNSRLLLKVTPEYGYGYTDKMFLLSGDTFENSVKLDWPPPFEEDSAGIFIVGSVVNGILCLCQRCESWHNLYSIQTWTKSCIVESIYGWIQAHS